MAPAGTVLTVRCRRRIGLRCNGGLGTPVGLLSPTWTVPLLLRVAGLAHGALRRGLCGLQRLVDRGLAGQRAGDGLADLRADALELRDRHELRTGHKAVAAAVWPVRIGHARSPCCNERRRTAPPSGNQDCHRSTAACPAAPTPSRSLWRRAGCNPSTSPRSRKCGRRPAAWIEAGIARFQLQSQVGAPCEAAGRHRREAHLVGNL